MHRWPLPPPCSPDTGRGEEEQDALCFRARPVRGHNTRECSPHDARGFNTTRECSTQYKKRQERAQCSTKESSTHGCLNQNQATAKTFQKRKKKETKAAGVGGEGCPKSGSGELMADCIAVRTCAQNREGEGAGEGAKRGRDRDKRSETTRDERCTMRRTAPCRVRARQPSAHYSSLRWREPTMGMCLE